MKTMCDSVDDKSECPYQVLEIARLELLAGRLGLCACARSGSGVCPLERAHVTPAVYSISANPQHAYVETQQLRQDR